MRLRFLALLLAIGPAPLPALADPGHNHHGHHGHAGYAAGEPGDGKQPARTIQVTMRETDGKMLFFPDRLEIRRGEQIRFTLVNRGQLEHEFVLGTTEENLLHAELMKDDPAMAHDDPNGKRLTPKERGELLWRFTKTGEFEYGCLIPGHREAGMTGTIVVK